MKKIYILISLIMIFFMIYQVTQSYAKYTSQGIANVQQQAGAWVIEINDSDISSRNSTREFQINSLTYTSNQYVLANKIAPSTSGYFEIVIDPSGSSVAVRYDVTLDLTELDDVDAINFDSAYTVVNGVETAGVVRTGEYTYSGTISLSDVIANNTTTARFYIAWEDDGTGQNDAEDSRLGVSREIQDLELPITVVVSQYTGETLTPYE